MCQLRCLILFLPSLAAGPGDRSASWPLCRSPVSPCEFDLYQVFRRGRDWGGNSCFLQRTTSFSHVRGDAFQIFCVSIDVVCYALVSSGLLLLRVLSAASLNAPVVLTAKNPLKNLRVGAGSASRPPNPQQKASPGSAPVPGRRETTNYTLCLIRKKTEPPHSEEVTPRLAHVRAGRAAHAVQRDLQRQRREEPVWKSNFGRPTPSTRYFLRSCVCSMA